MLGRYLLNFFSPDQRMPTKKITGLEFSKDKQGTATCCRQVLTMMYFFHGPYCICFHEDESQWQSNIY